MPSRHNNFDALRLVAATAVIFSHAFLLSEGTEAHEPLKWLTGQTILGIVGVFVFFVISGYLVTQSWEATGSASRFAVKRGLRIWPGLALCILLCGFVLGPLVTRLALGAYLASDGTWDFVLQNLVLNVEHNNLPGVRFSGYDAFGTAVDGPLWSLPCEVVMYAMVLALGAARLLRLPVLLALLALGLARLIFDQAVNDLAQSRGFVLRFAADTSWLLAFFVAGMILYKLRHYPIFDGRVALLAAIALVASAALGRLVLLFPFFGAYLILYLAQTPWLPPLPAARYGDLSYGLYIYGWPVEQTLLYATGGALAWWQLFPVAFVMSAALAFMSWHLVEKRVLRLKPTGRSARG
ncbi:MAG TPA: acyltransferase [Stellaceae bacterium]|nr:acyltransferase [Stellaceae bacterium]